jgi:hypothetical protein
VLSPRFGRFSTRSTARPAEVLHAHTPGAGDSSGTLRLLAFVAAPFDSVSSEGGSQHRASADNADGLFAGTFRASGRHECLEHVAGCVARRRACPRVTASPKMYPSRTREESKSRPRRQHYMPICRAFVQAL